MCFPILFCAISARSAIAQDRERGEEVVANLAGGRVIIHVARDAIIFAAIDQPVEANSIPPRAMNIDATHVGILLGASEWRVTSDPKPVRMDKDFPHVSGKNPKYTDAGEAEPDLETIGVAFLERLRPLVSQLHRKIEFKPDEALFEVIVIGYAPNDYGPEVWTIEYRIQQEEIATRGDFWQTRLLRPRFTQLYPPEKKSPKTLVEIRYPDTMQGPTLQQLIEGNEPDLDKLARGEPRFSKVVENIDRGQTNKSAPQDTTDFLRAALPIISEKSTFIMGIMTERSFNWVIPPHEPIEKAEEDKNRPPEAPTLRGKIKP
ncbi:MAG: hypothetical protein ABSH39_05635 [Candidatus Acidiferrum sp.]